MPDAVVCSEAITVLNEISRKLGMLGVYVIVIMMVVVFTCGSKPTTSLERDLAVDVRAVRQELQAIRRDFNAYKRPALNGSLSTSDSDAVSD